MPSVRVFAALAIQRVNGDAPSSIAPEIDSPRMAQAATSQTGRI